jgi:GH25 family lysozyme M1 (1,4-beta-N-acetylmuramidase)
MLPYCLKALVSALLLPATILGIVIESAGDLQKRDQPKGIDVSSYQGDVNWNTVVDNGVSFAYIKATEGTSKCSNIAVVWDANTACISGYKNPDFSSQYTGATKAGLIRGGYHFARLDVASGAAQAD